MPELLDLHFLGEEQLVGAYLLDLEDGLTLVDCGPDVDPARRSRRGWRELDLEVADLRHLLLTHIHFDHAGAAGALVAANPRLRVHVSEQGAPHLIDPERLERSARRLYGDMFDLLWGPRHADSGREHRCRRRAGARPRVLSDPGARSSPRLLHGRGRDPLRRRRGRRALAAERLCPAGDSASRRRPRGLAREPGRDRAARARLAGATALRPGRRARGAPAGLPAPADALGRDSSPRRRAPGSSSTR